jgi:hypothetical protein
MVSGTKIFLQKDVFPVKGSNIWVVGQFEMGGARTVPVRSGWQRRSLGNSPVAFIVKCAADGDRPRSGQTDPLPISGCRINLVVAAVCDRRKRRSQSAATVKILKMIHYQYLGNALIWSAATCRVVSKRGQVRALQIKALPISETHCANLARRMQGRKCLKTPPALAG